MASPGLWSKERACAILLRTVAPPKQPNHDRPDAVPTIRPASIALCIVRTTRSGSVVSLRVLFCCGSQRDSEGIDKSRRSAMYALRVAEDRQLVQRCSIYPSVLSQADVSEFRRRRWRNSEGRVRRAQRRKDDQGSKKVWETRGPRAASTSKPRGITAVDLSLLQRISAQRKATNTQHNAATVGNQGAEFRADSFGAARIACALG